MIYLIAGIVTLIYGCFVLLLMWQWNHISKVEPAQGLSVFATIIIPVRNESLNIENLIRSIHNGQTDAGQFEIIVVDDHSTDQTCAIVDSLRSEYDNLSVIPLPEIKQGKKAAISHGIRLAKGELIVCTDGDGTVAEGWLDYHRQAYNEGAKLSFGPVKLFNPKTSRWIDMLNQELAALVAMGAATLQMGKPTMINGCNYSFSKEVFNEVGGFSGNEHIASGDDEFLLRKIFNAYRDEVCFLKSNKALVTSEPSKSLKSFYNQRRRWASKWRFHKDLFSKFTPLILFLSYGVWACLIVNVILYKHPMGGLILSFKVGIDYLYIVAASKIQKQRVSIFSFALLQIIYPIYVVFFGVASNFGKYSWRDRTHKI